MSADPIDPRTLLAQLLGEREDLAGTASAIFDYAQYLLDDDERLTKGGALDGEGRERLRARALELLGGPAAEPEDDGDEESDDDEESDA